MNIIWQYLDKRSAAVNALKDYSSMAYILANTDEEIAQVHEDTTTLGSPAFTDMPGGSPNPQSGEMRIITAIDEIDVLRERYRQAKEYMEEGHFGKYNMYPKFRAAVEFLEKREGRSALITSFDKFDEALKGKTGTVIR